MLSGSCGDLCCYFHFASHCLVLKTPFGCTKIWEQNWFSVSHFVVTSVQLGDLLYSWMRLFCDGAYQEVATKTPSFLIFWAYFFLFCLLYLLVGCANNASLSQLLRKREHVARGPNYLDMPMVVLNCCTSRSILSGLMNNATAAACL
ncbi:hypothetical protein AMTRI_Chr01g110230 [Amborella trichopoda]